LTFARRLFGAAKVTVVVCGDLDEEGNHVSLGGRFVARFAFMLGRLEEHASQILQNGVIKEFGKSLELIDKHDLEWILFDAS
jgi:hypothetical protein